MTDLLIHGTAFDGSRISLAIEDATIVAVDGAEGAREEIDFGESLILPSWIDAHVHFNEPGRTEWEGLATGSRALAAGGGTAFIDMPLNSTPPVISAEALLEKRRIAEEKSCLDFALWGGLTPDSVDQMEAMADAGVIGFKAFMCDSGIDDFLSAHADVLKLGMEKAAARQLPVAVHAEIPHDVEVGGDDMPPGWPRGRCLSRLRPSSSRLNWRVKPDVRCTLSM